MAVVVILASSARAADDEAAAYADFRRAADAADSRRAEDAFEKAHPDPAALSNDDVERLAGGIAVAALDAMDRAAGFEKRFPNSARVSEIRGTMAEVLSRTFGAEGLPMPPRRAADVEAYTRGLLRDHPDNARGLSMVLCRVGVWLPPARGRALLQELTGEGTPEPARSMARTALAQVNRLGSPLELKFTALDGHAFNLADSKGKVVIIDFWATTCGPCVRELPELKSLREKYSGQGLEIVGVSLDTDKDALNRFVEREKLYWPQYYDPAGEDSAVATQFGVRAIPVLWLVDRRGVLRDLNGRTDLAAKVEALINE